MPNSDNRDWCPVCYAPAKTTKELADHMKKEHNRLILEKDINRAAAARADKIRALELEEGALLA